MARRHGTAVTKVRCHLSAGGYVNTKRGVFEQSSE